MDRTTSPETQTAGRHPHSTAATPGDAVADEIVEHRLERRARLRDRHALGLIRLMEQRSDLRGVLPLADLVDDSIRWTA